MSRPKGSKNAPKPDEMTPLSPAVAEAEGIPMPWIDEPTITFNPFDGLKPSTVDRLITQALKYTNVMEIRKIFRTTLELDGIAECDALRDFLLTRVRVRPAVDEAHKIAVAMHNTARAEAARG